MSLPAPVVFRSVNAQLNVAHNGSLLLLSAPDFHKTILTHISGISTCISPKKPQTQKAKIYFSVIVIPGPGQRSCSSLPVAAFGEEDLDVPIPQYIFIQDEVSRCIKAAV